MEILPGIHWVRGVIGSNCWLVAEHDGIIVIDTGLPGNAKRISGYLKSVFGVREARYIVLTHADIDHSGSAEALKALTGAKIALHTAEAAWLSERGNLPGAFRWISKLAPRLSRTAEITADILLNEGNFLGRLEVVHTPGHTPGSICLWRRGEIIFTGDAIRTHANDRLLIPSPSTAKDMEMAMSSLEKIAALSFDVLCGGHGPPVIGDGALKLRSLISGLPRTAS